MIQMNDSVVLFQTPSKCTEETPTPSKTPAAQNYKISAKIKCSALNAAAHRSNGIGLRPRYVKQTFLSSTGFHNLPNNVLVKVFSYFSEQELSSCVAPVCRSWRFASQDASLWKTLQFKGSRVATATICALLRRAKLLEAISLVNVPEIITILRQLCRSNSQVKRVAVKCCTNTSKDEQIPENVIGHLIRSCPEIESLDFDNTQFFLYNFIQDLLHLPKLRSVNLSNNAHLRARDLVTLSHNCWRLEELKVARRKITDAKNSLADSDAELIFDNLKNSLKIVKFDMNGLGAASYEAIFKCSNIESLRLNNAFYLTGDIFKRLPACLPKIKILKIERGDLLLPEDFVEIFTLHKDIMKNLTCLKLVGCWKLDDSGIKTIANTCAGSLECLSVRSCKLLTVEGIQYAVTQCTKLRFLDIAHVIQLDEPVMMLILKQAPSLKVLIIDEDSSNEGTLSHIISKKPQLVVKRSFSEYFKHQIPFK